MCKKTAVILMLMLMMPLFSAETHAGEKGGKVLNARQTFALIPTEIFDNTRFPMDEEEKELLAAEGISPQWIMTESGRDVLRLESADGLSRVCLRLFRSEKGAVAAFRTEDDAGECISELWYISSGGHAAPLPLPPEPPSADFFRPGRDLPGRLSASCTFCVFGMGEEQVHIVRSCDGGRAGDFCFVPVCRCKIQRGYGVGIDIVKAEIELTELRAPFDGVIGLRQISVGAYASPTTVVSKLTRIVPLKVEFAVPEKYVNEVNPGTALSFTIDGSLQNYSATVYAKESALDQNTHTLTVRALYANPNGRLTPGRYASINLKKQEIEDAIAIPSEAIVPEMGKDKVFLYKSGKAQPVDVTVGLRTEDRVQVLEGLRVGDTLITSGTLQLRTDLPVVLDRVD